MYPVKSAVTTGKAHGVEMVKAKRVGLSSRRAPQLATLAIVTRTRTVEAIRLQNKLVHETEIVQTVVVMQC